MAVTFMWNLQNIWPFSSFKYGNMTLSKQLVSKLSIPEDTKEFVFAIRDPQTQSIIYILSTFNLSKRSAFDVECLIKEIKPDAVVVQAGNSPWTEIQSEENNELDVLVPTSSFGVIKGCFVDKIGKEKYENVASNCVLREIFGTSFYRHLMVAKRAAEEVGSSFVVLESPLRKFSCDNCFDDNNPRNKFQSLVSSLVPQKGSLPQMVKALSLHMDPPLFDQSSVVSAKASKETWSSSYETPDFARAIYPFFEDLHYIFADFPSIGRSLAHVQKLLLDVNGGEVLDPKVVSEVYTLRVAVEGLRLALSNGSLQPSSKIDISNPSKIEFSKLPVEDKSNVILAQALRSQTNKFKTIVAVVDAGVLAGIRKHWHTPLSAEFNDMLEKIILENPEEVTSYHKDNMRSLTEKLIVLVSAAGTIILGTSSVTRVILALKTPITLKLFLSQTHRAIEFAVASSKVVAPGIATSGAKTSALMKAIASIGKKRGITQFFMTSAEKISNVSMRTALYEILRKRKLQQKPVGFLPWATLACSAGTFVGLHFYRDEVECAVESLPAAPSIARLGRGVQNLREASQVLMQTEGTRIRNSIESLINRMKKGKAP